ncbi:MAG: MSMEG_0565 family glycosyltransferase [Thermosynechococcaceae cyanobacterium]
MANDPKFLTHTHVLKSIRPHKIALLTYATKPRGSVIHTLELATALHHLGHTVCIYALDKDQQGFDRPVPCQVKLIPTQPAPPDTDALIQQRIQEFVNALQTEPLTDDCYHAQDCISANALAILRQQHRIPHFIRTVHHIEDYTSPYLQHCQDRSIRDADLCLCVSQTWQTALQTQYQIQAPRVSNGVNGQRFSSISQEGDRLLQQRLNLNGSPRYLTIGGIEPRKNSIRLLQAFAEVLAHHPTAQLIIAGGATLFDYQTYRDTFFAQAAALNISIGTALILPGVIPDAELPALYRSVDAFVFPSVKEGWGLVILEAIASGLPVITANQPPFTEFLSPTQALLIDPASTTAIAQAMQDILHPDLAQSLVQQSQTILLEYTWEASAQRHIHHYQTLLAHA